MTLRTGASSIVRFSVFELDLRSGELRKSGARVPLQGQPLEILKALLEYPGQLVTRDELRQRLWPDDTFVDFEDGMNAAVRRLRDALGDQAATPRFVETLPRRGYRFIAPLVGDSSAPEPPAPVERSSRGVGATGLIIFSRPALLWVLSAIVIASVGLTMWLSLRQAAAPAQKRLPSVRFEIPTPPLAAFGCRRLTGHVCTLPTIHTDYTEYVHGASWGDDDHIVFESGTKLWRVSASGGVPQGIPMPDDMSAFFPDVLPGSQTIVFTGSRQAPPQESGVWALSLRSGEPRLLVDGGRAARYLRSGHLMYAVKGALVVAPLDSKSLTLTAPFVKVVKDARIDVADPRTVRVTDPIAHFTVSQTGTLAYVPGPSVPVMLGALVWVDRDGHDQSLPVPSRAYAWPRLSPGGSRLAVGVFDGVDAPGNIKIYDLAGDKWTTLTSHPAEDSRPLWTADGLKVAFRSYRDGGPEMFWQSVDGKGQAERLMQGANADRTPWAVSPDGKEMVFSEFGGQTYDLRVLQLDRSGTRTLPRTRFFKGSPAISPNGRWIAYRADESGVDEIYVRPYPRWDGTQVQISKSGGRAPVWSADGRELFFLNLSGAMMVVPVQTSDHFIYATPKLLFGSTHVKGAGGTRNYDVAPDGRFLMIKEVERQADPPARDKVTVVVNWADEVSWSLVPKK